MRVSSLLRNILIGGLFVVYLAFGVGTVLSTKGIYAIFTNIPNCGVFFGACSLVFLCIVNWIVYLSQRHRAKKHLRSLMARLVDPEEALGEPNGDTEGGAPAVPAPLHSPEAAAQADSSLCPPASAPPAAPPHSDRSDGAPPCPDPPDDPSPDSAPGPAPLGADGAPAPAPGPAGLNSALEPDPARAPESVHDTPAGDHSQEKLDDCDKQKQTHVRIAKLRRRLTRPTKKEFFGYLLPIGLSLNISYTCNLASLQYISTGLYQMLRSAIIFTTAILSMIFLRVCYPPYLFISYLMVMAGVCVLFVDGELVAQPLGVVFVFIGVASVSFRSVWQKRLTDRVAPKKFSPFRVIASSAAIAAPLQVVIFLAAQGHVLFPSPIFAKFLSDARGLGLLATMMVCTCSFNTLHLVLIHITSPTTVFLVQSFRVIILSVVGVWLFNEPLTVWFVVGAVLTFAGMVLYGILIRVWRARQRAARERKRRAAQQAELQARAGPSDGAAEGDASQGGGSGGTEGSVPGPDEKQGAEPRVHESEPGPPRPGVPPLATTSQDPLLTPTASPSASPSPSPRGAATGCEGTGI